MVRATTWLSIYGAITGTASLLIAILAHRRAGSTKLHDERTLIKARLIDSQAVVHGLRQSILECHRSHLNVLSGSVGAQSGPAREFERQVDDDVVTATSLRNMLDSLPVDKVNGMSLDELENLSIELHDIHSKATALRDRYKAIMAADDEERRHRRR
jgi:hypothetical protein